MLVILKNPRFWALFFLVGFLGLLNLTIGLPWRVTGMEQSAGTVDVAHIVLKQQPANVPIACPLIARPWPQGYTRYGFPFSFIYWKMDSCGSQDLFIYGNPPALIIDWLIFWLAAGIIYRTVKPAR